MAVNGVDTQCLKRGQIHAGNMCGNPYFVVLDYRGIKLVHKMVDHAQEAERSRIPRVKLNDFLVRSFRFRIPSMHRSDQQVSGIEQDIYTLQLPVACAQVHIRRRPRCLRALCYLCELYRLQEQCRCLFIANEAGED